jgi:hypothetical protein
MKGRGVRQGVLRRVAEKVIDNSIDTDSHAMAAIRSMRKVVVFQARPDRVKETFIYDGVFLYSIIKDESLRPFRIGKMEDYEFIMTKKRSGQIILTALGSLPEEVDTTPIRYMETSKEGIHYPTGVCYKVVKAILTDTPMFRHPTGVEHRLTSSKVEVFSSCDRHGKGVYIRDGKDLYKVINLVSGPSKIVVLNLELHDEDPFWYIYGDSRYHLTRLESVEVDAPDHSTTPALDTRIIKLNECKQTEDEQTMKQFKINNADSDFLIGSVIASIATDICEGEKLFDDTATLILLLTGDNVDLVELKVGDEVERYIITDLSTYRVTYTPRDPEVKIRLYEEEVDVREMLLSRIETRDVDNHILLSAIGDEVEEETDDPAGGAAQQPAVVQDTTEYWIPQEGQYVLVAGERDVFVIKDYDVLDECFYLVSADSGRAHRNRQMADSRSGGVKDINARSSNVERSNRREDPEHMGYFKVHESYVTPFRLKVIR